MVGLKKSKEAELGAVGAVGGKGPRVGNVQDADAFQLEEGAVRGLAEFSGEDGTDGTGLTYKEGPLDLGGEAETRAGATSAVERGPGLEARATIGGTAGAGGRPCGERESRRREIAEEVSSWAAQACLAGGAECRRHVGGRGGRGWETDGGPPGGWRGEKSKKGGR